MSLILEALKKAERQHRMGEVPGIGSVHHDTAQQRSKFLGIFLLGAVAIGMLTLGIYLGEEDPVKVLSEHAEPHLDLPAPVSMQPVQFEPPAESVVESGPVTLIENNDQLQEPKSEPEPIEPVTQMPVVQSPKSPVKAKIKEPPSVAKNINDLPDGFLEKLPPLNIDIHSYDKQPGRSYVLINMEKYRAGDTLTEGPVLSEVLMDGVVLEYMGERFVLPIGNY